MNDIAQILIDRFPDAVNDFGLLGCGLFSAAWIISLTALYRAFR